jgi:hypothetical protein
VLISPLLVAALSLAFNKQQGIAEPSQRFLAPAAQSPAWVPTLAQASIPVQITRHGNQVVINGRRTSMPWSQRQQSLGIADAALIDELGLELLDTNSVIQQPVEWFSDRDNNPLNLATWLTKQYRYLDISALQQQFGWQIGIEGNTLKINTPEAKVTNVRQGPQTWGDRIVIDLDRATPWQVTENQGETVVTLNAQIDPALVRQFKGKAGKQIKSLRLETSGSQTLLRFSYPSGLRPRVWTLPNPNRLLIDVRPDGLVTRNILWAPGVRWWQQWVTTNAGQFPVVGLEIDPRQPGVSLRPILSSNSNSGTAPLFNTAQRTQGIAAINGGFFNRNNQLPLGAIRSDNRWLSGPILNRGALAWNDSGEITFGHLNLQETLTSSTGKRWTLQGTNSAYVGAGVARYTPDWGRSYRSIIDQETLLTVQNGQIVSRKQASKAGTNLAIPSDGYLLVVRADQDAVAALSVGTSLTVESLLRPDDFDRFQQVMGAGPLLLQNSRVILNAQSEKFSNSFIQERAPRSIIATTSQGTLLMLTVHQRLGGAGPTLAEAAQLVQQLGVVNALNLDGGSSTTLYLGGQLLNRPPSTAAAVNNGIGVFIEPNS